MANDLALKIKISADAKEALDGFVSLSKKLRDSENDFRAAQETVQRLAREIKASDAPSKELVKQFEKAKAEVKQFSANSDELRDRLGKARAALSQSGVDVHNLTDAYKKLSIASAEASKAKSLTDSFKALDFKPFAEVQTKIDSLNAAYKQLADSGKLSLGELAKAKLQLKDKTAELHSQMNNFGGALENLNSRWLVFAGALASGGAAFNSLIDAGLKMESVKSQLNAVTGSGEKTADALKYLHDESNRLGQRTDVMAEGFAKLAAAAKGTALEGQPLKDVFSAVAEASTVMHLSTDKTSNVINALSQMMGKGVVSAEEFRQQLGDHLPQATQVGAQALGVTTAEFIKLLNSGQILANDFLPKFGKALRESVAGGLPQAVGGATAAFNRLYNALLEFKQGLAEGVLMKPLALLANALAGLVEIINDFTPVTKGVIAGLAAITGGFALWKLAIAPVVSAIGSTLIPVLTGATFATGALATATKALPWVAVTLAVIEGARALQQWWSGSKQAEQATQSLNQQTANTKAAVDAAAASYDAAYNKMAESLKNLSEFQKNQYREQLAALDAKLAQETAGITANAALSETEKEKARNQAFLVASQERLTLIAARESQQIQIIDQSLALQTQAKQAQLQATAANEVKARQELQTQLDGMELSALEARRGVYAEAQADLQQHVNNLIGERQREVDAAKNIGQQILDNEQAREQSILAIKRSAMTEQEILRSKEKEESQKIADFKKELAKGENADATLLNKLAREAAGLIKDNAIAKANAATSAGRADLEAEKGARAVNGVYNDLNTALALSKTRHENNATAISGELGATNSQLSSIQTALSALDKQLLDAKKLRIEIDQDSLAAANDIIAGLTAPATKTITVQTVNAGGSAPAEQATGGLAGLPTGEIWKFATGGYLYPGGYTRKKELLPGYGGGDTIKALLEKGEFIVRKEAVEKLGVPTLMAINQGRLPTVGGALVPSGVLAAMESPIKRASGGLADDDDETLKKKKKLTDYAKGDAVWIASNTKGGQVSLKQYMAAAALAGKRLVEFHSNINYAEAAAMFKGKQPGLQQRYAAPFISKGSIWVMESIEEKAARKANATPRLPAPNPSFEKPTLPASVAASSKLLSHSGPQSGKTVNIQFTAPDGGGTVKGQFDAGDAQALLDLFKTAGLRMA